MKKWFPSVFPALLIIIVMTGVFIFSQTTNLSLYHLGIYPLSAKGLLGILLAPFIHENANHLYSNIIPFFVLTVLLFYFYKDIAYEILGFSWIMTGVLVWFGARPAYHIGASGVVYALMAFHVLSGMVRKNPHLLSISLLIVFLYGGMIWGIFPDFIPGRAISWESHLAGLITGCIWQYIIVVKALKDHYTAGNSSPMKKKMMKKTHPKITSPIIRKKKLTKPKKS